MEATLGLTRPFSFGRGWPQVVILPVPAAGKGASFSVPGNRNMRLVLARATIVCSAQVANRTPRLRFQNADGLDLYQTPSSGTVLASTEQSASYGVGAVSLTGAATGFATVPLPDPVLTPGMRVLLDAGALQTEDQLSALRLYLEQWPNDWSGYPAGRTDGPVLEMAE